MAINNWSRLDNAAKIFPSASGKTDTQVFRLSCELYGQVEPAILQRAIDDALHQFDIFRCVLRRGWFWYYLDNCDEKPVVDEENLKACAPLYKPGSRRLLFRVSYYGNRINLEVFHSLADGTGAMHFFKGLVLRYLAERHHIVKPPDDYDASGEQMRADSFLHYYDDRVKSKRAKVIKACQLRGHKFSDDQMELLTGHMSVKAALEMAHSHHVSLTTYLCACMMEAVRSVSSVSELKKPVVACVPVNLRKYFESSSMRNFFNTIYVSYQSDPSDDFSKIVEKVNQDFKEKLDPEKIRKTMNAYVALEDNIFSKVVPLAIKDAAIKLAYRLDYRGRSYSLSNVGQIKLPDDFTPHVRSFDVYGSTNQMLVCVCTYQDVLSIGFASPFVSTDVQRQFFRHFTNAGVDVEIMSNMNEGRDV